VFNIANNQLYNLEYPQNFPNNNNKECVTHTMALPFTLKKHLKAKEEL
jgi:hypothetical protein